MIAGWAVVTKSFARALPVPKLAGQSVATPPPTPPFADGVSE